MYFIGIIPPDDISVDITEIKKHFKEKYNSSAALRSPPHITMHMPFRMTSEKLSQLIKELERKMSAQKPLQIELKDFGAFPPRVIFIHVEDNDGLSVLQKEVSSIMRQNFGFVNPNYKDQVFRAHITVAFRDLRKAEFKKSWEIFAGREFRRKFTCSSINILKHNGKFWEVDAGISFLH